jgi:hypothetical protein
MVSGSAATAAEPSTAIRREMMGLVHLHGMPGFLIQRALSPAIMPGSLPGNRGHNNRIFKVMEIDHPV